MADCAADVVVVGAGIVGCAVAYYLSLIPSQKPVLRKFQRFSTCERYRMLG